MARLKELSLVTDVPGQITRTFVSPASMKAAALVGSWMKEAGMSTFIDAAGSVRGRLEGTRPDLPAVMLGSHLDTVINAGAYDGTLGVRRHAFPLHRRDGTRRHGARLLASRCHAWSLRRHRRHRKDIPEVRRLPLLAGELSLTAQRKTSGRMMWKTASAALPAYSQPTDFPSSSRKGPVFSRKEKTGPLLMC